jgi:general secretion pathway protein A
MLLQFFGFKDNPFKLAPDPAYLFLGRYYEEALAHLRYAVTEGEGFTAITGARGIGKTTICRAFLDTLGDGTAAAFISSRCRVRGTCCGGSIPHLGSHARPPP